MNNRRARFDDLYSKSIDPWDFRTSPYEKEKYSRTLAALPRAHYGTIIEAGCSIGELSRLLVERCDCFYGIDVSEIALNEAKRRVGDTPYAKFVKADLPDGWLEEPVDLVVLSEFLYFLARDEIDALAHKMAGNWKIGGDCIIVSFLESTSEVLGGAQSAELMAEALRSRMPARQVSSFDAGRYRIDVYRHMPSI